MDTISRFFHTHFTTSWLYPFKGIYYVATHRFLWPLLKARFLPLAVLSTAILIILFLTAYLPQVAVLALFQGIRSAWVNGTFLVLSEGGLLIAILFEAFFVDETQVNIFDATLVAEGHDLLVRNLRAIEDAGEDAELDPASRLGKQEKGAIFAPFSLRQIIEFVILLPLNFIPYVGVPLFLLLTGYRAGPFLHWRYFKLRGFSKKERSAFIKTKRRRWEYMWFGTVALLLQIVPVLSMLFLLSTAAGSALWAAEMEDEREAAESHERRVGVPPAYTDIPPS
ncbi:hypothetical protein LTR66_005942 [Elasticomyces elasticus]|nr:hypothetical protein LTR50_002555 [Elasticomyces elasticus]KAK4993734.1 hypothetical protein LTR66_005942 [Elasticomyces elasticus]